VGRKYGPLPHGATSKVLDACEEKVIGIVGKNMDTRTGDRVWFLPREMALIHTEMAPGWGFLPKPYPIMWWFYYYKDKGKLQLSMEIGPISDQDYRLRLVKKVKGAGFIFSKYASERKRDLPESSALYTPWRKVIRASRMTTRSILRNWLAIYGRRGGEKGRRLWRF